MHLQLSFATARRGLAPRAERTVPRQSRRCAFLFLRVKEGGWLYGR